MINLAATFVLVAILGADNPPEAKQPLSKETTYFTGPLDKEGYVDYQAALNERLGKGITPETNANVLLWKALGPAPDPEVKLPAEYFELLGMEEPPTKGEYLIDLATYLRAHARIDQTEVDAVMKKQVRAGQRPWKEQEYPHLAGWLAANKKPLALVVEATSRSDYFNPLVTDPPGPLIGALMPGVQKSRELARALTCRAMLRLEQGQLDDAWQDLLACHRLGRLVARGAMLIETLVGIAIDGIASNADLSYIERSNPLHALDRIKDLQGLPPLPSMADKFDLGERTQFLDALQRVRRGQMNREGLDAPGRKLTAAQLKALEKLDWFPALRNSNIWFDNIVLAMRDEKYSGQVALLGKVESDLVALGKRHDDAIGKFLGSLIPAKKSSVDIGDKLVLLMLPGFRPAFGAQVRAEQVERNLHVAFALAAFRADEKRYPEKLVDLTPKYLPAAPSDIFTGRPIVYIPNEMGYLLYSVGVNGKDEAGRSYDDDPRGDDLSVRMPLPELKPRK